MVGRLTTRVCAYLNYSCQVCDTSDVESNSSATNAAAVQGVTFSPQCQGFTKLNAASLSSSAFFSKMFTLLYSVAELNQLEPVVLKHRTNFTITLGAKWDDELEVLETGDKYIIGVKDARIDVCLTETATDGDIFEAMMIAAMKEQGIERNELDNIKGQMQAMGYSFSADHLVVEKFRVSFNN